MSENKITTVYSSSDDITFIMEETESTLSVKGFYFGEPDDEATKKFYGSLTAEIS